MPRIAIVTDTDSSIPLSASKALGIIQVPIMINFDGESYAAVEEIDDAQVFSHIDSSGKLPTTAAPSPGKFAEAFAQAFKAGAESILCFCVSSEVSATYGAAMAARELTPHFDITVIDTRSLSMGFGFMVLEAAEAAQNCASKEEIINRATAVGERSHLFAALSTLKYLAMSGRVSQVAAGFASVLSVKPILTIREGKLDLLERVRTQSKAFERVIELALQTVGDKNIQRLCIIHVNAMESARAFEANLRQNLSYPSDVLFAELTPGLSIHSGAGLVGVCFVTSPS
jgi:DegV family protein with EDD domain